MNLNIFKVSSSVDGNFEKPNIALALVIVIVPAIIAAIGYIADGLNIDWAEFAIQHIVMRYVLFFVLAAMIFAIGIAFHRKSREGLFAGVVSALGFFYVFAIILAVISQLAQRLVFSPAFLAKLQLLSAATTQEAAATVALLIATMPKEINFPLFFALIIIGLIIYVWQYFTLYKIISFSSGERPWVNIACWAVVVFIYGLISAAL
ncbi:MAG: hypothetical protein PHD95_00930 [Candidatus ainarchaeum sp.]|nr:hypothetical protein [Candidatus ainarchaeum sp.]